MKYKIASFFAGIGGFDVAFERKGFSTEFLCEINPFCNDILQKHWPNIKKSEDINTLSANEIPPVDVWCGGFPCQDISVARGASQRLGLSGARSGLFFRYAELIKEQKPTVVIIENVEGLFNSNHGRDFGTILQVMTSLGYAVSWRLLNSRYFGVPQSRIRIYMCCWLGNPHKSLRVMFDSKGAEKPDKERVDFMTEESSDNEYPKVPKVSYCLAASSGRHTGTDWSRTYVVCHNGVRRMTPLESERLQGFPDYWTLPMGKEDDDIDINTLRYTAIGNAVSVPVVEWIADKVRKELDNRNEEKFDISYIHTIAPELNGKVWHTDLSAIDFSDDSLNYKWEKGGFAWDGGYMECNVYPTPAEIRRSSLLGLIERGEKSPSYYLSPNAAEGILRRVDHQGRTLFHPLRMALEKLKSQKYE